MHHSCTIDFCRHLFPAAILTVYGQATMEIAGYFITLLTEIKTCKLFVNNNKLDNI